MSKPRFRDVASFLDHIGRGRLRQYGFKPGQMRNWAHRDGKIAARHLPTFTVICAEIGLEVPLELFSAETPRPPARRESAEQGAQ